MFLCRIVHASFFLSTYVILCVSPVYHIIVKNYFPKGATNSLILQNFAKASINSLVLRQISVESNYGRMLDTWRCSFVNFFSSRSYNNTSHRPQKLWCNVGLAYWSRLQRRLIIFNSYTKDSAIDSRIRNT